MAYNGGQNVLVTQDKTEQRQWIFDSQMTCQTQQYKNQREAGVILMSSGCLLPNDISPLWFKFRLSQPYVKLKIKKKSLLKYYFGRHVCTKLKTCV